MAIGVCVFMCVNVFSLWLYYDKVIISDLRLLFNTQYSQRRNTRGECLYSTMQEIIVFLFEIVRNCSVFVV